MKALCTEAALHALRRRYPQIYNSEDKLQLDVASINISAKDFYRAMQDIVPTAQRSTASPGRALSRAIEPLLQSGLSRVLEVLHKNFPRALSRYSNVDTPGNECVDTPWGDTGSTRHWFGENNVGVISEVYL